MNNILKKLVKICHENLLNNSEALSYLIEDRKITKTSIKKWELGLFPHDLRKLFEIIQPNELREIGIIKNASKSMFQTRDIIIPINDVYGNYIAISGRTRLTEKDMKENNISKYINSIYAKSNHLFGMHLAKKDILKKDIVYVVEGYFDVIMPYQNNFKNIVATCGTALSTRHIALLSRYTNNIVLFFDNEKEAQDKVKKIIEKKKIDGINLSRICPLPSGTKDIDQFLKNYSIDDLFRSISRKPIKYYNIKPLLV